MVRCKHFGMPGHQDHNITWPTADEVENGVDLEILSCEIVCQYCTRPPRRDASTLRRHVRTHIGRMDAVLAAEFYGRPLNVANRQDPVAATPPRTSAPVVAQPQVVIQVVAPPPSRSVTPPGWYESKLPESLKRLIRKTPGGPHFRKPNSHVRSSSCDLAAPYPDTPTRRKTAKKSGYTSCKPSTPSAPRKPSGGSGGGPGGGGQPEAASSALLEGMINEICG